MSAAAGATPDVVAVVHEELLRGPVPPGPARRRVVRSLVERRVPLASDEVLSDLTEEVLARVEGLGPLEPFLADAEVTDILVNGPGPVWIERLGRLETTGAHLDEPTIEHIIQRVVAPLGLRADRRAPLVDARLRDGSRVNAVLRPLAVDGPCLAIRRFAARSLPLEAWGGSEVVALLHELVTSRRNVVVTGATGAGKTTMLNSLAAAVGARERIITIEDAAELQLGHPHVVRLEARRASAEGVGAVTIRDLLRNALRMRPDRLVIGEVRGAEALDLVQALNTGHDGSLATVHSNGPADALRRLATMALYAGDGLPAAALDEQLRSALDVVVAVRREADGRRRIAAVDEVIDEIGPARTRPLVRDDEVVAHPSRPARAGGDR